jgi:hypothetical protein
MEDVGAELDAIADGTERRRTFKDADGLPMAGQGESGG